VVIVYRHSVGKKEDCRQVYAHVYQETVYTHSYSKYERKLLRMIRELSMRLRYLFETWKKFEMVIDSGMITTGEDERKI